MVPPEATVPVEGVTLAKVIVPLSKFGLVPEFVIGFPVASATWTVPVHVAAVQVSAVSAAVAATPLSVSVGLSVPLAPNTIAYECWFSASTLEPLSISTAKVWAAGTLSAADHAIVQADVHDVVEPAGVVAPSMKTAAPVVPGEM